MEIIKMKKYLNFKIFLKFIFLKIIKNAENYYKKVESCFGLGIHDLHFLFFNFTELDG